MIDDGPLLLVVDDDVDARAHVARVLRRAIPGSRVLVAGDSPGAVDALETHPLDVVVSAHRGEGIDGVRFLSYVAARGPHVVRILLASGADAEGARAAMGGGRRTLILERPIPNATLVAAVQRALQEREGAKVGGLGTQRVVGSKQPGLGDGETRQDRLEEDGGRPAPGLVGGTDGSMRYAGKDQGSSRGGGPRLPVRGEVRADINEWMSLAGRTTKKREG